MVRMRCGDGLAQYPDARLDELTRRPKGSKGPKLTVIDFLGRQAGRLVPLRPDGTGGLVPVWDALWDADGNPTQVAIYEDGTHRLFPGPNDYGSPVTGLEPPAEELINDASAASHGAREWQATLVSHDPVGIVADVTDPDADIEAAAVAEAEELAERGYGWETGLPEALSEEDDLRAEAAELRAVSALRRWLDRDAEQPLSDRGFFGAGSLARRDFAAVVRRHLGRLGDALPEPEVFDRAERAALEARGFRLGREDAARDVSRLFDVYGMLRGSGLVPEADGPAFLRAMAPRVLGPRPGQTTLHTLVGSAERAGIAPAEAHPPLRNPGELYARAYRALGLTDGRTLPQVLSFADSEVARRHGLTADDVAALRTLDEQLPTRGGNARWQRQVSGALRWLPRVEQEVWFAQRLSPRDGESHGDLGIGQDLTTPVLPRVWASEQEAQEALRETDRDGGAGEWVLVRAPGTVARDPGTLAPHTGWRLLSPVFPGPRITDIQRPSADRPLPVFTVEDVVRPEAAGAWGADRVRSRSFRDGEVTAYFPDPAMRVREGGLAKTPEITKLLAWREIAGPNGAIQQASSQYSLVPGLGWSYVSGDGLRVGDPVATLDKAAARAGSGVTGVWLDACGDETRPVAPEALVELSGRRGIRFRRFTGRMSVTPDSREPVGFRRDLLPAQGRPTTMQTFSPDGTWEELTAGETGWLSKVHHPDGTVEESTPTGGSGWSVGTETYPAPEFVNDMTAQSVQEAEEWWRSAVLVAPARSLTSVLRNALGQQPDLRFGADHGLLMDELRGGVFDRTVGPDAARAVRQAFPGEPLRDPQHDAGDLARLGREYEAGLRQRLDTRWANDYEAEAEEAALAALRVVLSGDLENPVDDHELWGEQGEPEAHHFAVAVARNWPRLSSTVRGRTAPPSRRWKRG